MNIEQARKIDMVDYLSSLGFQYARYSKHPNYWYHSPLRDEKTPSFKVNRILNKWKDWGASGKDQSGDIIDFGTRYFKCDVSEFLQRLEGPGQHLTINTSRKTDVLQPESREIKIITVKPIESYPLIAYYRSRCIPDKIARQYLKEAIYELDGKRFYSLAFPNDVGGYELRNKHIKLSSAPKGPTHIQTGSKNLSVFEGNFNMLSYRTLTDPEPRFNNDLLILNSAVYFEGQIPTMKRYDNVFLFLDQGTTGENCTRQALAIDREKFHDCSSLYQGQDDLNAWHKQHQDQKQVLKQINHLIT